MPDIAMCLNARCPAHRQCWRFTATPSDFRQSYRAFAPEPGEARCASFLSNGAGDGGASVHTDQP